MLAALPVSADVTELEVAGFFARNDSIPIASDSLLTLSHVLRHIGTSFPNSPQAAPANRLLGILVREQAQRKAKADSLIQIADSIQFHAMSDSLSAGLLDSVWVADSTQFHALSDSLSAEGLDSVGAAPDLHALSDSLSAEGLDSVGAAHDLHALPDSLSAEALDSVRTKAIDSLYVRTELDPRTVEEMVISAQRGAPTIGNIDWSPGGYTIHLSSHSHPNMARASAINFDRTLRYVEQPLDVFSVDMDKEIEFRVGLGLFPTVQEADSVMNMLVGPVLEDAQIVQIRSRRQ